MTEDELIKEAMTAPVTEEELEDYRQWIDKKEIEFELQELFRTVDDNLRSRSY